MSYGHYSEMNNKWYDMQASLWKETTLLVDEVVT